MSKNEIDYSKSVIYKIVCKDINITECYVDSTTNLIKQRWAKKTWYKNSKSKSYNIYVYQFNRESGNKCHTKQE